MKPDWCDDATWEKAAAVSKEMHIRDMQTGETNPPAHIARAILAAKEEGMEEIADWADATADHYDAEAVAGAISNVEPNRAAEKSLKGFAAAIRSRAAAIRGTQR